MPRGWLLEVGGRDMICKKLNDVSALHGWVGRLKLR